MSLLARFSISLLFFAALPVLAQTQPPSQPDPAEQEVARRINAGVALLQQGHAAEALSQEIDPAVAEADAKIAGESRKVYTARTAQESLLYLAQAASEQKGSAVVLSFTWSQAYFLKGYLLNEIGRTDEARSLIQRALDMAPMNAQYLGEMGNIEGKNKNWDAALKIYIKGEEAANSFSPDKMKIVELGEMLRGQGFVLVELHRLDEAENVYRHCLSINPNDQRAARELQFVLTQKGQ